MDCKQTIVSTPITVSITDVGLIIIRYVNNVYPNQGYGAF